ncbi:MAG: hypothetical protein ACOYL6_17770 [Bacteriovoracaceae bacterium]
MKLLITMVFLFTTLVSRADMTAQSSQLLSYFGASCSVNGEWTKAAVGYAENLIEVMKSLRDDEHCKTVAGSISDITNLKDYVQKLQNESGQKELMALQKEEQVLLLSLSSANDASEKATISSELRNNQIRQAVYTGYDDYNNSQTKKSQEAMETLVINTQAFLSTINANQQCLQNNSSMLTGIASMVASVVSSVLPTYGPIIKAGVELTGQIVEFSRVKRINKHIRKISQSIASTAYQCALESISNSWCNAQDTVNAINLKEVPPIDPETDSMWTGVRILDRELPSLLKWLEKVRAGSIPTNSAEAERQNLSVRREMRVQIVNRFGKGTINENRGYFNDSTNDKSKWTYLRKMINAILTEVRKDNDPSALSEIYSSDYSPYYLLGLSRDEAPGNDGYLIDFSSFDPFTQWPKGKPAFIPDLTAMEKRFDLWISIATINMQREILQVLQVSPLEVMDDAINDEGKLVTTPRKAITNILRFMKLNIPEKFVTENHKRIYEDTIKLLEKIAINIDDVHDQSILKNPLVALTDISDLAQLRFGTVLIDGRVTRTIRYALNNLVVKHAGNEDIASQLLAADDIVKSIERVTPNMNLTATRAEILNSQSISQKSASTFANLFAKSIKKSLEDYDRLAIKSKEGPTGPNRQMKAGLCIKLMTIDEWPKKIPFELCKGAQLMHIHPKGPRSVVVTEDELEKPFAERVCRYRDFLRRSYIFQNYQNHLRSKRSVHF